MGRMGAFSKWTHRIALRTGGLGLLMLGAPTARAGTCAAPPPEVVAYSYTTQSGVEQQDDFEDGLLDRHWSLKHIEARSYAYTNKVVKEGQQALLITVRHGDK